MKTITKKALLLGAILFSATTFSPLKLDAHPVNRSQADFTPEGLDRLRSWMKGEVNARKVPGMIVMVQRNGRTAFYEAVGDQDAARGIPMKKDAIFRLASMTKPITTVAAMMLVEEGKLTLDTPLSSLIPAFKEMKVAVEKDGKTELEAARRQITIHDLLRHTSGLTYGFFGNSAAKRAYLENKIDAGPLTNAEFADQLAKMPLNHQPGTTWDYSYSTDILGRVVEVVSGMTLGDFFKKRIFEPLGMKDTVFSVADLARQARIAEPYSHDYAVGAGINLWDPRQPQKSEAGGQGLSGTAGDYAKFLTMILNGGFANGKRFLSPKTIEYMGADHLGSAISKGPLWLPGPGYSFGLGFANRTDVGLAATFANPGEMNWGGAAGTAFWVDKKANMFVILMMQSPKQRTGYRPILRNLVYGAMSR